MVKSLQFELWQECNSGCLYCYNSKENLKTDDKLKIEVLEKVLKVITNPDVVSQYENFSFIGGEFFQGQLKNPEVRKLFFQIIEIVANYLKNKTIKSTWITMTLTIGNQEDLYTMLEYFKDIPFEEGENGVWLTTSYDTLYRFHTQKMEDNWKYHMKNIHKLYPQIKFNTTMILMRDLVVKYLNDEFSFKDFQDEYNTLLFFKQPIVPQANDDYRDRLKELDEKLPQFFPTRKEMLKFLKKVKVQDPWLYTKLFNIQYRADNLYRNFNDEERQMMLFNRDKKTMDEPGAKNPKCGHVVYYQCYKDSDACCLCDKLLIDENM